MPSQDEIETQLKLLRTHRRTLAYGLEQLARFGPSFVPPYVRSDIDDARAELVQIKQTLRAWGQLVDDEPNDDGRAGGAAGAQAFPAGGLSPELGQAVLRALETQRQNSGDGKLYQALQGLNYSAQKSAFVLSVKARTVAAYLIDGQRNHGQRWLLNLLLKRYEHALQAISIDMRRLGRGKSIADLCQEIGRKAGVAASTPEQLAPVLCRWWETQHTFLIFHSVDLLGEAGLREILEHFWRPIVTHAGDPQHHNAVNKLLLFLVDNQGVAAKWNLPLAQNPANAGGPERLPTIARFSEDELDRWMMASLLDLPDDFSERTDVQTILANTDDGIPESVLEEICVICDYDWNEGASRWLKH
jgi:hypothetical protein